MAQLGGTLLGGGDDRVRTVIGLAHDVLRGDQALSLLVGVADQALGFLPSLSRDGVGVRHDVLGPVHRAWHGPTCTVNEVEGLLTVDDGGGTHRHGA